MGIARRAGFSLIETAVVLAVIAVAAAIAIPQLGGWQSSQRLRAGAREVADMLTLARAQAIRSGRNHVVFFAVAAVGLDDAAGNPIVDLNGDPVPVLLIDDGAPDVANCLIDDGEIVEVLQPEDGLAWGVTNAAVRAPLDDGLPPMANGVTFANPVAAGAPVNWILFRPDGIPVSFSGSALGCGALGGTGTGVGAIYVTNGDHDYSIVLSPLGAVHVHAWRRDAARWSS